MRKLFAPDFDRHPLNETEVALDRLETSWADFVYGLRGHGRFIRAERRSGLKTRGLLRVHQELERHRGDLIGGNRTATLNALIYCAQENVPLPYWLGDELLDIWRTVNNSPSDLHELFGLAEKLPARGKKSRTLRRDMQLRGELWDCASELMARARRATLHLSMDAAIMQARAKLKFPYSQRKSRQMFDEQERIQRAHKSAAQPFRVSAIHRIK